MGKANLRLVSDGKEMRACTLSRSGFSTRFVGAKCVIKKVFSRGGSVALFALRVLRYLVFYPLMWLRIVVCLVCHLATVGLLVGLLLGFFLIPDTNVHRSTILWAMGGGSFAAFCIGWLYDGLLLALSPEPLLLDSRRNDY